MPWLRLFSLFCSYGARVPGGGWAALVACVTGTHRQSSPSARAPLSRAPRPRHDQFRCAQHPCTRQATPAMRWILCTSRPFVPRACRESNSIPTVWLDSPCTTALIVPASVPPPGPHVRAARSDPSPTITVYRLYLTSPVAIRVARITSKTCAGPLARGRLRLPSVVFEDREASRWTQPVRTAHPSPSARERQAGSSSHTSRLTSRHYARPFTPSACHE